MTFGAFLHKQWNASSFNLQFDVGGNVSEKQSRVSSFGAGNLAQISLGAIIMAFPVAVTEEVWNLGAELSTGRVLLIALASVLILSQLVLMIYHVDEKATNRKVFFQRVLSTYGLTLFIAALLLFGIDKLELLSDPVVGLKRAILVAFPACFAATVVDSIKQ